jgi:hypothetical protein
VYFWTLIIFAFLFGKEAYDEKERE